MKIFSTKFLFLLAFSSLVVLSSCNMMETVSPVEKTTKKAVVPHFHSSNGNAQPVIISSATYNGISAPFTINGLTIEDEIIMLTTTYKGGCGTANFILASDGSVGNVNGKPSVTLKLLLDDRDGCKKNIETQENFDLSPIHQPNSSSMIINIVGFGSFTYSY